MSPPGLPCPPHPTDFLDLGLSKSAPVVLKFSVLDACFQVMVMNRTEASPFSWAHVRGRCKNNALKSRRSARPPSAAARIIQGCSKLVPAASADTARPCSGPHSRNIAASTGVVAQVLT